MGKSLVSCFLRHSVVVVVLLVACEFSVWFVSEHEHGYCRWLHVHHSAGAFHWWRAMSLNRFACYNCCVTIFSRALVVVVNCSVRHCELVCFVISVVVVYVVLVVVFVSSDWWLNCMTEDSVLFSCTTINLYSLCCLISWNYPIHSMGLVARFWWFLNDFFGNYMDVVHDIYLTVHTVQYAMYPTSFRDVFEESVKDL